MSGGSFDYVCFKLDDSYEIFQALPNLRKMEQRLRDMQKHEAANEIFRFILLLETCQNRLEVAGKRLFNLTKAVEWHCSGDWSEDSIDHAMDKLASGTEESPKQE